MEQNLHERNGASGIDSYEMNIKGKYEAKCSLFVSAFANYLHITHLIQPVRFLLFVD